jgi:hypothetical protein
MHRAGAMQGRVLDEGGLGGLAVLGFALDVARFG